MTAWEELRETCLKCQACQLRQTCTQVVFGVGDPNAEVLFIGEAPGANEDAQGEPFVGRAGKLLDDMLAMIGLHPAEYLYHQLRQVPSAGEPGPAEHGEGRLPGLSAGAGAADEAQDHRVSGAHQRHGADQAGLQNFAGARPVL